MYIYSSENQYAECVVTDVKKGNQAQTLMLERTDNARLKSLKLESNSRHLQYTDFADDTEVISYMRMYSVCHSVCVCVYVCVHVW
jgi:hypothetical protein